MCGINGIALPSGKIKEMNVALAHRGPDFRGSWSDDVLTLGHTLLSIRDAVDVSKQPVAKSGSPWVLVFNGQIYNVRQIKASLSDTYANTDLDTILIYALLEKYGWDFIRHLEGMYALGVYNAAEKKLRLYRDSAGQKNLYYTFGPPFAFSSEIAGLIAGGVAIKSADETGLAAALVLGYIPGRKTLFAGIEKLCPGEILTIEFPSLTTLRDWIPEARERVFSGEPREVMRELVAEHLASKQKVALNLSGGLDSSILLHEAHDAGHEIFTYTTRFSGAGENFNDDADLAKRLARDYDARHTEILITPKIYRENLARSLALVEEPNYNVSLATYLEVARLEGAHGDGNRVVLSGDGGDELFGGYAYYAQGLRYDWIAGITGYPLFSAYKALREGMRWDYRDPLSRWLRFKFFFLEGDDLSGRRDRVRSYLAESLPPSWEHRAKDSVRDLMLLDRYFWLAGENFIRGDKLFMSESLEMRAPLSYEPLRAYFDARLTKSDYIAEGGRKKYLRELYTGVLPDYITKRPLKTGWRSPVRPWWDADMKEAWLSILEGAPEGGHMNWEKIRAEVGRATKWPGKYFHLYLSLAALSERFNVAL